MSVHYAPQEKQYFDQLFTVVDKDSVLFPFFFLVTQTHPVQAGVLPGQDALPFLVTSGLPQQTLGEIWALADPENNGFLTRDGWYKAARLIGWMQTGNQSSVDDTLGGPFPTFAGQAPPPISAQNTGRAAPPAALPAITPADRTKFTRIFVGCGPQNGLITGDKARDVYVMSQLSYDKLGQIWNLADTQQRGSLDLPDFIIGMFLIQSCMANPSLNLPATLPAGTYEQASGGRPPASPVARQNTGGASPVRPQYTGGAPGSGILQPQRTGQSVSGPASTPRRPPPSKISTPTSFTPNRQTSLPSWDVNSESKAKSDRFFTQLDTQNKGVIEGDVAVPFMLQSQLDEGVLATIWDLADIRHEGKLTRDEFAVAMHLINTKLAGQDVPTTVPNSLIPPSLREEYGAGSQEVLAGQGPSSVTKDLFDLFDDPPQPVKQAPPPAPDQAPARPPPPQPAPFSPAAFLPPPPSRRSTAQDQRQMSPVPTGQQQSGSGGFAPAPPSDLLGDDAATPSSVPDNSAELGNKQNQLSNTTRSLTDLGNARGELEKSTASSATQLEELEAKLSEARVKHEAETKAVDDLRVRLGEQTTRLQQLQSDVIAAESDLSAMRSEEDELGQGLLRDKEEVRGLQKRMKEIEDEKAGLKLLLEKLRKEARQQKGLVTIAKKQLSTAEGSRESLQKDIKEAEAPPRDAGPEQVTSPSVATPAGVPLPGTPRALSPTPTGMSQRSNNPFDKLARGPQSGVAPQTPPTGEPVTSPSLGSTALVEAGTAVGAAAGYVAAGAQTLFNAAKHAVSPETEQQPAEAKVPAAQADPLAAAPDGHDTDPFGAPASAGPTQSAFDSELGSGFGDSFSAPTKTSTAPTEDMHLAPSSEQPQRPNDFDSAFEDFGDKNRARQPEPITGDVQTMGIPSGIPKSFIPFDIRPDAERSLSTQAMASSSPPQTPVSETVPTAVDPEPARPAESTEAPASNDIEELVSSEDEREEPEDLEAPNFRANMRAVEQQVAPSRTVIAPALPVLSMPSDDIMGRVRRSAPPPPSARSTSTVIPPASQYDDLDPFGARTESTLPPGAAPAEPSSVPKAARFDDDDDFDFSDMPPAQVDQAQRAEQHPPSAFDDKFAGFDDDFDKPSSQPTSGSDNSTSMTKSYEMVAPQLAQNAFVGQSSEMPVPTPRTYDEWGLGGDIAREAPAPAPTDPKHARGISFDDAFGGAFEPAPPPIQSAPPARLEAEPQFAPPPGPPPAQMTGGPRPPAVPQRRESQPQADDLEDVKKLCAMGFPRSLVIKALDANDYDFQRALNVLLVR